MIEQWRDIINYESLYQISNLGRVRNLKGKILCLSCKEERGYKTQRVQLSKEGQRKWWTISRLVAISFVLNPANLPQVDHKDRDTENNIHTNLRWVSPQHNARNRGARSVGSSLYKGVHKHKSTGKWRTTITVSQKTEHIGIFDCEHAAAQAYNGKAIELFGEYAVLNIILK